MIRALSIALVMLLLGWVGATWLQKQQFTKRKKILHQHIAAIRTYQEGYALRHDVYLALADSCRGADGNWARLGMTVPPTTDGCFRAEPVYAGGHSEATGVRIIGVTPDGELMGVETHEDRAPTWRLADGTTPLR